MMKLMDKYLNINLFKLGQKLIVILFHYIVNGLIVQFSVHIQKNFT